MTLPMANLAAEPNYNASLLQTALPDSCQTLYTQNFLPVPTFYFFSQLPTELRLEIYTYLFPPHRRISLHPRKTPKRPSSGSFSSRTIITTSNSCNCAYALTRCEHHPVTLYMNRESRAFTLHHYEYILRDYIHDGARLTGADAQRIYFRRATDSFEYIAQWYRPWLSSSSMWLQTSFQWGRYTLIWRFARIRYPRAIDPSRRMEFRLVEGAARPWRDGVVRGERCFALGEEGQWAGGGSRLKGVRDFEGRLLSPQPVRLILGAWEKKKGK